MAMSAFLAGCTEATLVPFERVQTLMQETKYHGKFKNTPAAFYQLYTQYGVREYYRGLSAVLMRNGPSNVIFFASREKVRKIQKLYMTMLWLSTLTRKFEISRENLVKLKHSIWR